MKLLFATRLFLLFLLATPLAAQRDSAFMTEFRQAMSIHDMEEMTRILKRNEYPAITAIIETCELISQGNSEQLEEDIDGLGKAWKAAFDNKFVTLQYEYFSFLSGEFKRHRKDLIDNYLLQYAEFEKAKQAKEKGKLTGIGLKMEGLADSFEEIGDYYMASVCAWSFGECFDEGLLKEDADLRRSCSGYGKALAMRDKCDLRDTQYGNLKNRFDELETAGYGDPTKGPDARAKAKAAADASYAPKALSAAFEVLDDMDKIVRPIYHGDGLYPTWKQAGLGAAGSTADITTLGESSPQLPKFVRESFAKVFIDVDGDGDSDGAVPVTGKPGVVQVKLPDGRQWACIATIGTEKDTFQGIQPFNLGPSDVSMTIYFAPAGSLVATIGETRVQVFDDNLDGRYGSEPKLWNAVGMRAGDPEPEVDSILIGDSKRALPWSELVKIGDDWYRLASNEAGSDIIASKTDVETGTLKLDMKGLSCDYLILQGTGNNDKVFVDVAAEKKGVEVPVGSYKLFTGRVSKGKRNSMMKALIAPSNGSRGYKVAAGETTEVELGAPFGFLFAISQTDETVKVDGKSVVVTGRGKETYQRFWNCVPRPEAAERKEGSKKAGNDEKMRPIENQLDMESFGPQDGWIYLWFPVDVEIPKKKKGEDVEVQLIEKKNKLFGKIESEWIG